MMCFQLVAKKPANQTQASFASAVIELMGKKSRYQCENWSVRDNFLYHQTTSGNLF